MAKKANRNEQMMGTSIDLMVVHQEPEGVLGEMVELLKRYERRFSANDASSELAEVNQAAGVRPVRVHPELFELIALGKKHSLAPGSFMNIAIGPLTQSWRIGFDDARVPSASEIEALLRVTNSVEIQLNDADSSVYLKKKGMKIDLGALAKGYIADRLIAFMNDAGVASALINLGGNLVTYGPALKRPDQLWRIGIQNPIAKRGDAQLILKVHNKSVVTSGVYERELRVNGEIFHHIIDPSTGYPMETDIASLTICSDLSVDGEIWTTRLFGYSPHEVIKKLDQMKAVDGLVITKQGEVLHSRGLASMIV